MKHLLYIFTAILFIASCSKDKENLLVPENFNSMNTEKKMEYIMKDRQPDSVALFISDIAMGKVKGASIDMSEAQLYVTEHYNEDDLVMFVEAVKKYENALPLDQKMKFVKLGGMEDPELYSYELGLSYVGTIREDKKDAKHIKKELEALKKASDSDPEFYKRFMKGFKLALKEDRGRDLDEKIFLEFINYQDSI